MNIFTKTKNNLRYAYYRICRDKALKKMKKHEKDTDPTEWKKWANIELKSLQRCSEIPIK